MTTTDTVQCNGYEDDDDGTLVHDQACPVHHDPEQMARSIRQIVDGVNALPKFNTARVTLGCYADVPTFMAVLAAVEGLGGTVKRTADTWRLEAECKVGQCTLVVSNAGGGTSTREVTETVTKKVVVWPDEVEA